MEKYQILKEVGERLKNGEDILIIETDLISRGIKIDITKNNKRIISEYIINNFENIFKGLDNFYEKIFQKIELIKSSDFMRNGRKYIVKTFLKQKGDSLKYYMIMFSENTDESRYVEDDFIEIRELSKLYSNYKILELKYPWLYYIIEIFLFILSIIFLYFFDFTNTFLFFITSIILPLTTNLIIERLTKKTLNSNLILIKFLKFNYLFLIFGNLLLILMGGDKQIFSIYNERVSRDIILNDYFNFNNIGTILFYLVDLFFVILNCYYINYTIKKIKKNQIIYSENPTMTWL